MTLRIAIAGIAIESSTFTPHRTTLEEFWIQRGEEMTERYPFLDGWHWPGRPDVEFVPLFSARALPGGRVFPETYDALESELLDRLEAALAEGSLDGFYFDIHGAMYVDGRYDAEAGLAAKIRDRVGPDCLMSTSMDLHGQVSQQLASTVELMTAYRTAPHVDYFETRERACRNLVHCLTEGIRPVRAWVSIPVLLPGEKTSTRIEPAQSIYASVPDSEARDGVIDASVWVGYAWADEPRSAATTVVYGTDEQAVTEEAERLAWAWWDARRDFAFCAPTDTPQWSIKAALDSGVRPFFVSDSGDNPTGGGSNDVAWFLGQLLATESLASGERTAIWASCVAPDAVAACVAAGTGGTVTLEVGGVYGGSEPVALSGEVTCVHTGDPVGDDIAVVRSGGVSAVLTTRRKPFHFVAGLTALGLNPAEADLTAVKAGYLQPDLHEAAAGWVMALTPGGVDQDLGRLSYAEVSRPIHPLDDAMPTPDLRPTILR